VVVEQEPVVVEVVPVDTAVLEGKVADLGILRLVGSLGIGQETLLDIRLGIRRVVHKAVASSTVVEVEA